MTVASFARSSTSRLGSGRFGSGTHGDGEVAVQWELRCVFGRDEDARTS